MEPRFHVMLEGRKVGPFDRRTIVGMRVRNTLAGDHVLVGEDGDLLTVRELVGRARSRRADGAPRAPRAASTMTYPGRLVAADRDAGAPSFRGPLEVRLQPGGVRLAGRVRRGLAWQDGRAKWPMKDIVHAGFAGTDVELGVRSADATLHRVRLDLLTPEAAADLVDSLASAAPWPEPVAVREDPRAAIPGMWAAAAGALLGGLLTAGLLLKHPLQ